MTSSEWRAFLRHYSDELLRAGDSRIELPAAARAARWMGFDPASAAAVEAAEGRLGRRLPSSLRAFYLVSNGWRATGPFIADVLPVEQVGWLRDRDPHLYGLACKSAAHSRPFKRDPDGSRLREYVLDQGTRVKRALAISSWGDAAVWLLDPGEHPHDAEWPAGRWASWSPGMEWQAASFAGLMKHELERFVRLRDNPDQPPPLRAGPPV
jgi:hypothetical protein